MSSFAGSDALEKQGIMSPADLLKFPWEQTRVEYTEDEKKQLQKEIEAFNNRKKSKPQP